MRAPSVLVKRTPQETILIEIRRKVAEKKQLMQIMNIELKSMERDLYLLEKSATIPSGSSDSS